MASVGLVGFRFADGVVVVALGATRVAALASSPLPVWLVLCAALLFCAAIVVGVVWQAWHRVRPAQAPDAQPERAAEPLPEAGRRPPRPARSTPAPVAERADRAPEPATAKRRSSARPAA